MYELVEIVRNNASGDKEVIVAVGRSYDQVMEYAKGAVKGRRSVSGGMCVIGEKYVVRPSEVVVIEEPSGLEVFERM